MPSLDLQNLGAYAFPDNAITHSCIGATRGVLGGHMPTQMELSHNTKV